MVAAVVVVVVVAVAPPSSCCNHAYARTLVTLRHPLRRTSQGKGKGVSSIFSSNPAFAGGEGMLLVESLKNKSDPDGEQISDEDKLAMEKNARFREEMEQVRRVW